MAAWEDMLKQGQPKTRSKKGDGFFDIEGFAASLAEHRKQQEEFARQEEERRRLEASRPRPQPEPRQQGFFQRAGGIVRDVGEAVIAGPKRVATGIARALPGGTADLEAAQRASDQQAENVRLISEQLRDPKVPKERKERLKRVLAGIVQDDGGVSQTLARIRDDTDKRKFLAALAETGLMVTPVGVGRAAIARGATTAAKARRGAAALGAEGAAGGVLVELQEDDPTLRGALESAAIGAGLGAALGGAAPVISSKVRALRNKADANAILDESRRLPAQAGRGADVITDEARLLTPGAIDPNLAVRVGQPVGTDVLKRLDDVERRITQAQQKGGVSAAEARDLMRERATLIQQIRTGGTKEAKQALAQTDDVMRTAQNAIIADGRAAKGGVPRLAQRTEARAVAEKLTEGFDDLPVYQRMNIDEQANRAFDLVEKDYERAKRIAMGTEEPPAGVLDGAVYKAVESKAARSGDAETLRQLATESTIPLKATQRGQASAVLAIHDPESPVDIIRELNKLRNETKVKGIPKFVSPDEAKRITDLAKDVYEKRLKAMAEPNNREARLEYGRARVQLDNYKETLKPSHWRDKLNFTELTGATKSLRASLDNSSIFRQGWKVLWTNPIIWQKRARQTFVNWIRQAGGKPVLDELKADLVSRPNALNGRYQAMKLDLNITEEAFPSSLPEKIPIAGRFYKASEAAYTAFVQQTRADIADKYLQIMERTGVPMDKKNLRAVGEMVNSLTGRGGLGRTGERVAAVLNNVFFSPRLLSSHFKVLTAHQFDKGVTPFVRKQAAINLLKIASGTAAVLAIANAVRPGSVEWDARSSNFGKIKIGNTRFDVSGGMSSLTTLAARIARWSTKSSVTGDIKSLTQDDFGARTGADVVIDFFANKLSPAAAVVRDLMEGEDFNGNPNTPTNVVKNLVFPLSVTNFQELKDDPKSANDLIAVIAEALGISTNNYGAQVDWRVKPSKELEAFRNAVGEERFLQANDKYNELYVGWFEKAQNNERYKALSVEDREKVRASKKQEFKNKVFREYGFKYRPPKTKLEGF